VRDNGSVIKNKKLLVTEDNRRGVDNDLFNVTYIVPGTAATNRHR
jgi:hypothetical protein